jgi:hypothetical protein
VVFFVFFILFLKSGTIQIVFMHNYILYTFGMFTDSYYPFGIFKLFLAFQCNCPSVKQHAYALIKNYKKNMSLVRWIYLAIIDQKVDNQQRLHALNMLCIRTSLEILWIFFRKNML